MSQHVTVSCHQDLAALESPDHLLMSITLESMANTDRRRTHGVIHVELVDVSDGEL